MSRYGPEIGFSAITFEWLVSDRGLLNRKIELIEMSLTVPISGVSGNIFGPGQKVVSRGRDPPKSIPHGLISHNIYMGHDFL